MKSALNINGSKYKLHKMQEKIESEERDNSNRASFMCPNCQKTFTDLEVSLNITIITSITWIFCHNRNPSR